MERLSRGAIIAALAALEAELARRKAGRCELVLVGGAALVLKYGARGSTRDVDAVALPEECKGAVNRVESCERSTRGPLGGRP